jgi:hypothetical protein
VNEPGRRSIRMSEDEAWAFVTAAHTGIFTTLRRDGSPIALPIWFAVVERRIYVSTRGKKVLRVRHDPRCSFLVEAGERWAELEAVHMSCTGRVLDDPAPELLGRIRDEMGRKYDAFRTPARAMPEATRAAYDPAAGAMIELTPTGRILTWDNRRLGLG